MKNRSKMILGLASMLGISAGTAAVSGFAWFTTQRTARVSASNFKVGVSEGALKISATGTLLNCATSVNSNNTVGIAPTAGELEDVSSGNGKDFYKAILSTDGSVDHIVVENDASGKSIVNTNQMVKVSWDVKVENTNPGSKLNVFLSNNGPIFKQNLANSKTTQNVVGNGTTKDFVLPIAFDKVESVKIGSTALAETTDYDVDAEHNKISFKVAPSATVDVVTSIDYSDCYRLAIYDLNDVGNASDDTLVYLFSNGSKTKYIKAADKTALEDADTTNDPTRDGTGDLANDTNAYISTSAVITKTTDTAASTTDGVQPNNQYLIKDLIADVASPFKDNSHTLRFVVWCEGTSTPDAAVVASNGVDMTFNLIGLTA